MKEKEKIDLSVRNRELDPESPNIIDNFVKKFIEWYETPEVDESTIDWRNFKNSRRRKGENINEFIQRYETYESNVRSSIAELPEYLLAIQFLEAMDVDENQKRNISSGINFSKSNRKVYDDVKKISQGTERSSSGNSWREK